MPSFCCCERMGLTVRALGSVLPQQGTSIFVFSSSSSRFSSACNVRQHQPPHISRLAVERSGRMTVARCEKHSKDTNGTSGDGDKPIFLATDFWLQVVIFMFAAGFVDAGFSGDWSRIGVLTKETEGELQMAAVGVVPLAATLIWSIAQRRKL